MQELQPIDGGSNPREGHQEILFVGVQEGAQN